MSYTNKNTGVGNTSIPTSIPLYKKLMPKRKMLFNDDSTKIIIDANPAGSGKTRTFSQFALESNENNMIFLNNHHLVNESCDNVRALYSKNLSFYHFDVAFGKSYKLSPKEQFVYKLPECLCNLHVDNDLYKLFMGNFFPSTYCKDTCAYRDICHHKKVIKDCLKNVNHNRAWLLVKSYIPTSLPKAVFKKFNDVITIIDESFTNFCFKQIDLRRYTIMKYTDSMNRIVSMEYSLLNDYWDTFKKMLNDVINLVDSNKYKSEKKEELIVNVLLDYVNNNNIKDLIKWKEDINETVLKNWYSLRSISHNLTEVIQDMLKNVELLNNVDDVRESVIVDKRDKVFTYIINNKELMEGLIDRSTKMIVTSATLDKDMFVNLFPDFTNEFVYYKKDYKPLFKNIYKKTYGTYPKFTLYNSSMRKPTTSFHNLIDITKQILEIHSNGNEKILIIAFKDLIKPIRNYIDKHASSLGYLSEQIQYDYWYNLEGKNMYEDFNVGVLFGSPGKPRRYINALSKVLCVPSNLLSYIFTQGEMYQGAERLRTLNDPYTKTLYLLSDVINENFTDFIGFKKNIIDSNERSVLDYIKINGKCTKLEIYDHFLNLKGKMSNQWSNQIVNNLERKGFIKELKIKTGQRGRQPSYYVLN